MKANLFLVQEPCPPLFLDLFHAISVVSYYVLLCSPAILLLRFILSINRLNGCLIMCKPGLILIFIANITFNGASVSWAKNAAYCETTQILEIDEHALSKSKNEQFRLVVSNKTVSFGINSFSGGTNTFKIIDYRGLMNWRADDDRFYVSFLNGNLYFSAVFPKSATLVSARCEIY